MITPVAILFILLACLGIAYIVRKNRLSAEKRVAFLDSIEKAPPSEWDRDSTRYDLDLTPKSVTDRLCVMDFTNTNMQSSGPGKNDWLLKQMIVNEPLANKFPYRPQNVWNRNIPERKTNTRAYDEPTRLEDFSSIHIATAMLADAILTDPQESANTDGGDFGGGGASGSWSSDMTSSDSSSSYDSGGSDSGGSFGSD